MNGLVWRKGRDKSIKSLASWLGLRMRMRKRKQMQKSASYVQVGEGVLR